MTFTLTNPNPTPLTGATFSDPLVANLSIPANTAQNYIASCAATGAPAGTGSCTGTIPCGTPSTTAQTGTLTWSGTTIPASGSCTVVVTLNASATGNYTNTVSGVTTNQTSSAGPGASDTLSVHTIDLVKSFAASNVVTGASTNAVFTLTNNSANTRTGIVNFIDAFPANMTIAALPPALPCGASSSFQDNLGGTLAVGDVGFKLIGATLAANGGSCTFSVPIKVSSQGVYNNTTQNVYYNTTVAGPPSNTAILTAQDNASITKSFTAPGIDLYDTSTVTYTLSNPNSFALANASFTDSFAKNPTSLIAGYTVASTAFGGTCSGVTGLPAAGASTLTLTLPSLLPGSCTVTVPVTSAEQTGPFPISYGSSSLTGVTVKLGAGVTTGAAPVAPSLTVQKKALLVTKTPNTSSANPGAAVGYTINYSNPNATLAFQNVVLTDTIPTYSSFQSASCGALPAGITSCNISAPAVGAKGTVTWTLGGTLNAGASGTLNVNVTVD